MKKLLTILLLLPMASNAQLADSAFNTRLNQCGRQLALSSGLRTGAVLLATAGTIVIGASTLPENAKTAKTGVYVGGGLMLISLLLNISANTADSKASMYLRMASGHFTIPYRTPKHPKIASSPSPMN